MPAKNSVSGFWLAVRWHFCIFCVVFRMIIHFWGTGKSLTNKTNKKMPGFFALFKSGDETITCNWQIFQDKRLSQALQLSLSLFKNTDNFFRCHSRKCKYNTYFLLKDKRWNGIIPISLPIFFPFSHDFNFLLAAGKETCWREMCVKQ